MKKILGCLFIVVMSLCCSISALADQSVVLKWSAPVEREDGAALTVAELGGYELRYLLQSSGEVKTVVVPDGSATSYVFAGLPNGSHTFEIAAYDTAGLYSNFVSINHSQPSRPGGVGNVSAQSRVNDVIAACLADPNCKVAVAGEW